MTAEGTVLVIAATGLALTQVITAWRTSLAVIETKALSLQAVKKLDVVAKQSNGGRTELLERIAALELIISKTTGDSVRTENAERAAAEHRAAILTAHEEN